jgi:RNA polymerase sigma factor (sigma-70 family)
MKKSRLLEKMFRGRRIRELLRTASRKPTRIEKRFLNEAARAARDIRELETLVAAGRDVRRRLRKEENREPTEEETLTLNQARKATRELFALTKAVAERGLILGKLKEEQREATAAEAEALLQGEEAFNVLLPMYFSYCVQSAGRVLVTPDVEDLAVDAAQQAFTQFCISGARYFKPDSDLRAYLGQIARRKAIDLLPRSLRRQWKKKQQLEKARTAVGAGEGQDNDTPSMLTRVPYSATVVESLPSRELDPADVLMGAENGVQDPHLEKTLNELSPRDRAVVEMAYFGEEEPTAEMIAAALGIEVRPVQMALHNFYTRYLKSHPDRVALVSRLLDRIGRELLQRYSLSAVEVTMLLATLEAQLPACRTSPAFTVTMYRELNRGQKRMFSNVIRPLETVRGQLHDLGNKLQLREDCPSLTTVVQEELQRLEETVLAGEEWAVEEVRLELVYLRTELELRRERKAQVTRVGRCLAKLRGQLRSSDQWPATRLLGQLRKIMGYL